MSESEDNDVSKEDAEPEQVGTNTVPSNYKTRGKISDPGAAGVFGYNSSGSGTGKGVVGHVESGYDKAVGVHGEAVNSSGNSDGVVGKTNGTGEWVNFSTRPATGVTGRATNQNANISFGVRGLNQSLSDFDAGVLGFALGDSGEVFGVRGETNSNTTGASGVFGDANNGSGQVYGVRGRTWSESTDAAGVRGEARDGGSGTTYGVYGSTSSNYSLAAGVKGVSDSEAKGVRARSASGMALSVTGINRRAAGGGEFPSQHAALVHDVSGSNSRVLALKTSDDSPSTADNFITFFRGDNTAIGAIESQDSSDGIRLNTSSADLGEYFPLSDPTLEPAEGTVLGLSAGELSRETADAEAALVVTRSPAVLGNNPKAGENEEPPDLAPVALIGQVPVKVTESVDAGDRLVAAGDGTARVGGPDNEGLTVGRALESVTVSDGDVDIVRTFVGGPMSETPTSTDEIDPQDVLEAEYEETIAELRRENERLSEENEELRSRLDDLEGTVETLVADAGATSGPEPADD